MIYYLISNLKKERKKARRLEGMYRDLQEYRERGSQYLCHQSEFFIARVKWQELMSWAPALESCIWIYAKGYGLPLHERSVLSCTFF